MRNNKMSNELVPYSDIEKMGKAVAGSGLFGVKTEMQAVALMLIAQAYGQHPAVAAMEYHIIEGKPSKKADAMLASFIKAGGSVKWISLTDDKAEATFSHPFGGTITLDWTIDRAKKAGLVDKPYSNYKKYPRAMLRSRLISEGVKTIYPAATGGMLTPEEVQEVVEETKNIDPSKSRVEQIIETTVSEVISEPKKEEENPKEVVKKTSKTSNASKDKPDVSVVAASSLPEGHKEIIGVIEGIPKSATVPNPFDNNKPGQKYNFHIAGLKYGTFDKAIVDQIMKVLDIQAQTGNILVAIEFKERISGDKVFNDIVKFRQVVSPTKEIPI